MKRIVLISMMALAAAGAWAQDLADFQGGFESFATDMAATLSYNATIGNNWSDAYIGQLPHFGVGLAVGFTAVPAESLEEFFQAALGEALPDSLKKAGLPIPAAALSAKIGGIILPFDFGIKAMVLPPEATEAISALGIAADYKLLGANIRLGLVKEGLLFPDVSLGAGYNRLMGSVQVPLDVPDQTYNFTAGTPQSLRVSDPDLQLDWTTDSFDFTLQVSKKVLFFRPFAGLGYSLGTSTVGGGLAAKMYYDSDTGGGPGEQLVTSAEVAAIKQALADAGQPVPDISADGFLFSATNSDPVLRVYGGLSLNLFFLNLDLQGIYVPKTKGLGANAMIRVQL